MTPQVAQRFQKPDVLRMFPSFVWKAELKPEIHEPINDLILRTLTEIGAPFTDLKPGESWQSDHWLHELRQFGEEFAEDFYSAVSLSATLDCHDVIGGTARERVRKALHEASARIAALSSSATEAVHAGA